MAEPFLSQPDFWRQLLALVLAATVVMGSPGPATISVTAVGAAFGLRDSLRYTCGIILGTIAVLLVVATGIMAVLASMPKLAPLLAVASAAYILYLASAPPLAARTAEASRPTWLAGFLLAVANPKAYVAIAAVFAGAASNQGGAELGLWTKLTVLAGMIVVIHAVWLLAGAVFARFLRRPVASRIINLVFAATLVLTTALAVFS
jgi:threonine/homoserine/homoserine lactone efflux protein